MSDQEEHPFDEMKRLYAEIERIDGRFADDNISLSMEGVYSDIKTNASQRIGELADTPEVQEHLSLRTSELGDLERYMEEGDLDSTILSEAAAEIRSDPVVSIVSKILGITATSGAKVAESVKPPVEEPAHESSERQRSTGLNHFKKPAQEVADMLVGKKIKVGSHEITVGFAKPFTAGQTITFKDDPIFGSDRVDAYVDLVRGGNSVQLYLRAGDDDEIFSCVQISGGLDSGGKKLKNPTQVSRELGLSRRMTGTIRYDGETVELVNLVHYTKPAKS